MLPIATTPGRVPQPGPDEILGIAGAHGSYAEYTIASECDGPIAKIPGGIGDADAAASQRPV